MFELYHSKNKFIFGEMMMMMMSLFCSRPTPLVGFYSATSLKQHSLG